MMNLANTKFPNICKYFGTFFAYCATKPKKMQKKKKMSDEKEMSQDFSQT